MTELAVFLQCLLMTRSRFDGGSVFNRPGAMGVRFRMASNIMPTLSPRNGNCPVAIASKTAPNKNKSVRTKFIDSSDNEDCLDFVKNGRHIGSGSMESVL